MILVDRCGTKPQRSDRQEVQGGSTDKTVDSNGVVHPYQPSLLRLGTGVRVGRSDDVFPIPQTVVDVPPLIPLFSFLLFPFQN